MAKAPAVNVVKHPDGWAVKRDNAERATRVVPTQREAIEIGRPIAQRDATELRIQRENGQWREAWSYGDDPFPPKG